MSEAELLNFDDLDISIGQDIEFMPSVKDKVPFSEAVVLGAIPGESLIITAPASGLFPEVTEGQDVLVRILLADGIAIFQTTILYLTDVPMFMVYLDFPQKIQFKRVRSASRVSVKLPVLASNETTNEQMGVTGSINDISTTGAGLLMTEELGEVGDNVVLRGKFSVGGIQRMLTIKGQIRAAKMQENTYIYGVEFAQGDEDDLLVLFGFIFNAMAFGKLQKIR